MLNSHRKPPHVFKPPTPRQAWSRLKNWTLMRLANTRGFIRSRDLPLSHEDLRTITDILDRAEEKIRKTQFNETSIRD